jgi:dTDP-glucose 4,6-dehydratase
MILTDKLILVTGAGGFIGSHLTETLLRTGHHVRAFVRYNGRNEWGWLDACPAPLRSRLEVVSGDICDPFGVRTAMTGCDVVFHLAALIAIPYSYHSPASYVNVNINGTLNVLQAARDLGVRRVVHTSTSETYGTAQFTPITEEHPLQGQSPYSATKIGADYLALSFYRSFGLPVAICRPFNTFGPRQSARAVIPTIITQLLSGQRIVKLGSLHPRREFNYVSDTVDGFLAIGDAAGVDGEVINIGCGYDVSIKELVSLIAEIVNVEIEVQQDAKRIRPAASEVDLLQASHAKATRLTGWIPACSSPDGLKAGLASTVEWFRDPGNLARYKAQAYNI